MRSCSTSFTRIPLFVLTRNGLCFHFRVEDTEVHGYRECLAQGHISSKWKSPGLDLGSVAAKPDTSALCSGDSVCVPVECPRLYCLL